MAVIPHQHLCMGCMREKGAAEVCPACQWREGSPAGSISELPPRTVINGAYVLGRVIGEGGFGITYIAWDIANRRRVALKEYFPRTAATRTAGSSLVTPLSPQSAGDFEYGLSRFSEESRVLTMFRDHPCIVSCLDFQSANGTAYLVMELLDGKTLHEYLRERNGRMPYEAALNVTMRILDGLREVHEHGLLHRDISPDNIFLTTAHGVKLLDFGAARFAMGERSQNLSVILKPGYAPPEQYLRRGRQGPRTDIYATAATMYRAVTGQVPPEALERQTKDALTAPSRLGVAIAPHAEAAILRGMSIKMRDRFRSAQEFQAALNGSGPPVKTRRPNVYLAYAVGTLLGALMYLPFVLSSHGLAKAARDADAATPENGAAHAPVLPAPSAPAPAPAVPAPAAPNLQVNYGTFTASLTGGRVVADVAFRMFPFSGHSGCAVLALADEKGKYLERTSQHPYQILRDFTSTGDQAVISVHFDDAAPEAATVVRTGGKLSAQTILFANPCSVEDDPVVSKSVVVPLRTSQ